MVFCACVFVGKGVSEDGSDKMVFSALEIGSRVSCAGVTEVVPVLQLYCLF